MIYMVDEITLKPGKLGRFNAAFEKEYLPKAKERGLSLVGSWIAPPMEMQGEGNTLVVLWSMDGQEGFWRQRKGSGGDPAVREWWAKMKPVIAGRTRRFLEATAFSPLR
jgi:hypothetical protein